MKNKVEYIFDKTFT